MAKIIQLVGTSATGKETVQKSLAERLRKEGLEVVELTERGPLRGLAKGYRLRVDKSPWVEAAIFTVDRLLIYESQVLKRTKEENLFFLFNRGLADNFVYQGLQGGVPIEVIRKQNEAIPWPNLSICLTVEGNIGYERALSRSNATGERLSRNECAERIDQLADLYRSLPDHVPELNLRFIDTSHISQEQTAEQAYKLIRDL